MVIQTPTANVIERARAYAGSMGWTKTELARAAGLGKNTLRNLDAPGYWPRPETLAKLAAIVPASFKAPTCRERAS